ncbi:hypothetical protein ACFQZX_16255 [Mucilaginibacter litoreus]|uniref:Alkaline phosphatase n=1 Tax=Mucilaginibacter litoreus TaxID=1048221 RepID=A0ABW3AVT7_9SPHI
MFNKLLLVNLLVLFAGVSSAQKTYTQASIHSHNDYTRPQAFYNAYNAGVGFIEADVYLRNGKLMVAHDSSQISADRTLNTLYLQPLQKVQRPVTLVIDLKESYAPLLIEVLRELQPIKTMLNAGDGKSPVTILITGNRPAPADYDKYPPYILFDDDLQKPHNAEQWKRVAEVSLNFANYSAWKGEGELSKKDEAVLKSVVNAVHAAGKKVRFWGNPDNVAGWQKLMDIGVDILNTDKIDELKSFIAAKSR